MNAPIYLLIPEGTSIGSLFSAAVPSFDTISNVVPVTQLSQLRGLRSQKVYIWGPDRFLPTQQQLDVLTKLQHLEFVNINDAVEQGIAWWYAAAEQAPISKWNISMGILHLFPEHVKDAWL